jgi:hypothetical protein
MLDTLITSKTRIKLMLKFFLNVNASSYLRALEVEFDESTNAIRLELNRFEKAGLLKSAFQTNKKIFFANKEHPLYLDIHNILLKYVGIDQILERLIEKLGNIKFVYLLGEFANGRDGEYIDLLIVGNDIDNNYLLKLLEKTEKLIKRKIRYQLFEEKGQIDFLKNIKDSEKLLLWEAE